MIQRDVLKKYTNIIDKAFHNPREIFGGYVFCGDYPIKNEIFFKKIFKKILTR